MFTGIIEEIGRVKKISMGGASGSLEISAKKVLEETMAETVRRSSLGSLVSGSGVNLERAMAANGRFGGHIVSGHIDGTGTLSRLQKEENAVWVYIKTSAEILRLIVEKGSITIDGISLTVAGVNDSEFAVSVIPHTAEETTLLTKKAGDLVNLENDIIGKYVEKLLASKAPVQSGEESRKEKDDRFLKWLASE